MSDVINLNEKFNLFNEHWNPKIIAGLNGQHVKLAKLKGEFVMHSHPNEDEMFWVMKGELCMRLKDGDKWIKEGECIVIPNGVEHQPIAEEEVWVVLFEPESTLNTGETDSELKREILDWI